MYGFAFLGGTAVDAVNFIFRAFFFAIATNLDVHSFLDIP